MSNSDFTFSGQLRKPDSAIRKGRIHKLKQEQAATSTSTPRQNPLTQLSHVSQERLLAIGRSHLLQVHDYRSVAIEPVLSGDQIYQEIDFH